MENASQVVLSPEWTTAPTALQSRMRVLHYRVEDCRQHLQAQNQCISGVYRSALQLQAQAVELKQILEGMQNRLNALGVTVVQAESEPVVASPSLPQSPGGAAPGLPPPPQIQLPAPGRNLRGDVLRCIPYLLIAAVGVGYGLTGHALPNEAKAATDSRRGEVVIASEPAASDSENEALRLVYEYRLPGKDQDMLDLLGVREDALGPSPWNIDCDQGNRCDVSFAPRGVAQEEPPYEFAVDLGAKAVTPSQDTSERLLSISAAQESAG